MAKEDNEIEMEGLVVEAVRGKFRVEIPNENSKTLCILATLSGKLKRNFIRIVQGDRVKVEISPYDMTVGRITYRVK